MNNKLYTIDNLRCAYRTKESKGVVLAIDKLTIDSGKIIFLLGTSGSGKSTLLEVLGLMSDTIEPNSNLLFRPNDSNAINFGNLWKDGKRQIADTRKQYFSFIFQDTNLMNNFTAYENVCLSKMIQADTTQAATLETAVPLMNAIGLPESEVPFDKAATKLSGGQRQRLAFVRALNTDFRVLLCDEPTGNLDHKNANELLRIIKQNLKSDQSAIIVSHDIELALHHADQIIVLTKEEGQDYSSIQPNNIFERDEWKADMASFKEKLSNYYQLESKLSVDKSLKNAENAANNYGSLFRKRELAALLGGKYLENLFFFVAMLAFTFIAVGFANGSQEFLAKKLNNPFTKWLEISIPSSFQSSGEAVKRELLALTFLPVEKLAPLSR